jgi:hypothetical protein
VARRVATERTARAAIERHGALLVYPVANRKAPASLWSELYPGAEMAMRRLDAQRSNPGAVAPS